MSAVDWTIWALSIFVGGFVYRVLDPVVQTIIDQNAVMTTSLDYLQWAWTYGYLIALLILPSIWVIMRYQKSKYEEYRIR